eukprot:TRINITY_DN4932_c0_g1_i5.p1 TRINITY_DN4932_c0_g1~~TRINITY_DN4932_c0_g1_i5.p1  ORF type:complete len:448 (+),score=93.77 TRINITY_DN4932_c0_g1_i5:138-1481(+)
MLKENLFKYFVSCVFLIKPTTSSPIVTDFDAFAADAPFIPKSFCLLPPELGYTGEVKFIEDCPSLERYQTVPLPGDFFRKLGTHPVVCCPQHLPNSSICFESDAWCPNYKPPEPVSFELTEDQLEQLANLEDSYNNNYDYENIENIPVVTDPPVLIQEIPTMADKQCNLNGQFTTLPGIGELSQCVPINQCKKILDNTYAPQNQTQPCGFDEDNSLLMICCPDDYVTSNAASMEQAPRFPGRNGKARPVEDKSDQCRKWRANDGCSLDKDLVISQHDPGNGRVISKVLFDFMQGACSKTCGWTGRKGCIDEHERCQEWARKGMCIVNPLFMTHTCRESCGVCGFLSPNNKEDQVVDGLSYSDFTKSNFDCGRYKPLCEINNEDCSKEEETTTKDTLVPESPDADYFDLRTEDDDVFFSIDPDQNPADYFCGATMVTDSGLLLLPLLR